MIFLKTYFPLNLLLDWRDVPCPQYVWAYVKNSTRAERLCCSVSVLVLAACIGLAVYFSVFYYTEEPDIGPWFIERDVWLAEKINNSDIDPAFEPLRLVVIQHSVSKECHSFKKCCTELRNLQNYFIVKHKYDIPYSFIVGNDGRIYEGRGWRKEGAHTYGYNRCSVGIGFIGDYREQMYYTRVTDQQQSTTHRLLQEGVDKGYLHPDYKVVGAKDVRKTDSPGTNLYRAIQNWRHYDHTNRFVNKTCEEINAMPFP